MKTTKLARCGLALTLASGLALSATATLAQTAAQAAAQQTAVAIPADLLSDLLAACTSPASCEAAVELLLAELAEIYPNVPQNQLIAGVAAEVAAAYNSGTIAPTVAVATFESLASQVEGNQTLSSTISGLITTVEAGGTIDLTGVAEAGGSPN